MGGGGGEGGVVEAGDGRDDGLGVGGGGGKEGWIGE